MQRRGQPWATVGGNAVAQYRHGGRLCALEGVPKHLLYVVDAVSSIDGMQAVAPDQVEDVEARLTTLHQRQEALVDRYTRRLVRVRARARLRPDV